MSRASRSEPLTFYPDNRWLANLADPRDEIEELVDEMGDDSLPTSYAHVEWVERRYAVGNGHVSVEYIRVIRSNSIQHNNRPQEVQS